MALRDIWRGREGHGEDRNRDWRRSMGQEWRSDEDWRDEDRFGRGRGGMFGAFEHERGGGGQQSGERSWAPETDYSAGGEYSSGRSYGGYGSYRDYERDEGRRYGLGGYGAQSSERSRQYGFGGQRGGTERYGMGQYRGRGPRGYQRSDDRIREEVCERLTDDPNIDASNMEVSVKSGEVTLSGTVNSRLEKRWAEECVEELSGVKDVHNALRVSEQRPGEQSRAGEQSIGQQTTQQTAHH